MSDALSRNDSQGSSLAELRLLHLADSAFPIGSLAHSFGLESLVDMGHLDVAALPGFLSGYLEEAGVLEASFLRAAFALGASARDHDIARGRPHVFSKEWVPDWLNLCDRLSALKPARESRAGSAALGENFLNTILATEDLPAVRAAFVAARELRDNRRTLVHHSLAFGLVAGALGLDEERAVLAFLHQTLASLVSACQRLLPLGQTAATRILWDLKPAVIDAAARSVGANKQNVADVSCFMPLLDWGAMEHPSLTTRLFIS